MEATIETTLKRAAQVAELRRIADQYPIVDEIVMQMETLFRREEHLMSIIGCIMLEGGMSQVAISKAKYEKSTKYKVLLSSSHDTNEVLVKLVQTGK